MHGPVPALLRPAHAQEDEGGRAARRAVRPDQPRPGRGGERVRRGRAAEHQGRACGAARRGRWTAPRLSRSVLVVVHADDELTRKSLRNAPGRAGARTPGSSTPTTCWPATTSCSPQAALAEFTGQGRPARDAPRQGEAGRARPHRPRRPPAEDAAAKAAAQPRRPRPRRPRPRRTRPGRSRPREDAARPGRAGRGRGGQGGPDAKGNPAKGAGRQGEPAAEGHAERLSRRRSSSEQHRESAGRPAAAGDLGEELPARRRRQVHLLGRPGRQQDPDQAGGRGRSSMSR